MKNATKKETRWVGVDVHAKTISIAVASASEVLFYGTVENTVENVARFVRKHVGYDLRVCYEAGPCGFALYRQLSKLGVDCFVVAPTKIPRKPGDLVKTDRRDATKLAELFRANLLSPAWVPSEADEALRGLVRARESAKKDELRARHRVSKLLLRHAVHKPEKGSLWSMSHMKWLGTVRFSERTLDITFRDYLNEVLHQKERIARLEREIDQAIDHMSTEQKKVVEALQTMRGVAKLTAVTLVSEIGSFSRFAKASELMSYVGMVPREYSSGGSRSQSGITKTGNAHVRRVICESAWSYRFRPALVAQLKRRNKACGNERVRAIAWKAQHRLNARYRRMSESGKPLPKVLCAVGRELIGFVWAIAKEAET